MRRPRSGRWRPVFNGGSLESGWNSASPATQGPAISGTCDGDREGEIERRSARAKGLDEQGRIVSGRGRGNCEADEERPRHRVLLDRRDPDTCGDVAVEFHGIDARGEMR